MQIHGITHSLWLLLLLHMSGTASMKFNIFRQKPALPPKEGDVRLAGSQIISEGRVEIYHNGTWGTVCDDGFDLAEARVVCQQLHFSGAKSVVTGAAYGEGSGPIWLDDMDCKGTEGLLSTCVFKDWAITDCSHKEDVGVVCEADTNTTISDAGYMLDHSLGLSEELGQLFDSGDACDFQILVQSATGNRQQDGSMEMVQTTICAHKMILSRFPRFNSSVETNISVYVSESCLPYFTPFIRYIYTRKTDVTISSAQCLHQMASMFDMKQLKEDTGRLFAKLLPEDATFNTAMSMYEYSVETEDLLLQESCVRYLAWNFQNLTSSPAWGRLSVKLLGALLSRSDLVVSDEYFLFLSLESWISQRGDGISLESQAELLRHIRFPMISAEKLYELQSHSTLHSTHQDLYRNNILKAFQFNVLLFSTLKNSTTFKKEDEAYQPRIYTAAPWAAAIDCIIPSRNRGQVGYSDRHINYNNRGVYGSQQSSKSFSTPVHNSMIFKNNMIHWEAIVFTSQSHCSNRGIRCESLPMARLTAQSSLSQYQSRVRFGNRLLIMCQGKYICQVQDFKNNLAYISKSSSQALPYPCPDDNYLYHFVVRPDYI